MGILDIVTGRVGHFNSIAVPVYNDISRNIQKIYNGYEESFFGVVALEGVAQRMIDLFFKPGSTSLIGSVKKYTKDDMKNLYSIFIIWIAHDLISFSERDIENETRDKLKIILGLNIEKFDYYFKNLKHGRGDSIKPDNLWKEVIAIIQDLPNTEENFLVFWREFSKNKNLALKVLNNLKT